MPGVPAPLATPPPGAAVLPPPTPVEADGTIFEVDARESAVAPAQRAVKSATNVLARLPDGHPVRAVADKAVNGFLEVETSLNGAHFRGFASRDFLEPPPAGRCSP